MYELPKNFASWQFKTDMFKTDALLHCVLFRSG